MPHDPPHESGRPHRHPNQPDDPPPSGHYQIMAVALRELLVEKGVLTAEEIRAQIEKMDARGPHLGARLVARAWSDPAFKARLLADEDAVGVDQPPARLDGRLALRELDVGRLREALGHAVGLPEADHRSVVGTDGEALLRQPDGGRHHLRARQPAEALLRRELDLFPEWYVGKHLGVTLGSEQRAVLEKVFRRILDNNLAQPRVYVHRDYHSRNLMFTEPNPGILDFQDAVYGPITYDLASLFKDAYIRWDEERIMDWLIRYWEKARRAGLPVHQDFGEFYRDYEWMGVQRHLKVLGIFARLCHRDGKQGYLKDMPLVFEYLYRACARYVDLKPLQVLLEELHPAAIQEGFTF